MPLARHCTWRCGGPADVYFVPADRAERLKEAAQTARALELACEASGDRADRLLALLPKVETRESYLSAPSAVNSIAAVIGKQVCSLGVLEKGCDRLSVGHRRSAAGAVTVGLGGKTELLKPGEKAVTTLERRRT
jgi:hypothetical protein